MASKQTDAPSGNGPAQFLGLGREQTEAMLNMQKELAEAYEQASRAWLDRVKSEAELWSDLASKLSATRSVPEAMAAYQASVTSGCRWLRTTDDGWPRIVRPSCRSSPSRCPVGDRAGARKACKASRHGFAST